MIGITYHIRKKSEKGTCSKENAMWKSCNGAGEGNFKKSSFMQGEFTGSGTDKEGKERAKHWGEKKRAEKCNFSES
jgi:hypothetical protein